MFSLSGCLNKEKLLRKEEFLLYSQKIEGNKKIASDDLEPFYRQTANKRILGLPIMPYLWLYYQGTRFYNQENVKKDIERINRRYNPRIEASAENSGRRKRLRKRRDRKLENLQTKLNEGNFLMRIGEPPVIYDSLLARQTAEQMQYYMSSKGFFDATAYYSHSLDTSRRTAKVTYHITENKVHLINDTTRVVDNVHIDSLLGANRKNTLIKPGDAYDEENLDLERERIDKLLKNNGYYNFSRQYVTYRILVDSTYKNDPVNPDNLLDIETVINKPIDRDHHQLYRVDDVLFTIDANVLDRNRRARRDTAIYNKVKYIAYNTNEFSKKVLDTKLLVKPGDVYSLRNTIETQRLLSSLDIFKFANVYYDTTGNRFTARINATPIEKYTISDEWGVTVTQQLPGPFVNLTFKARNVFGGLEIFETSLRAAIEGQTGVLETNQVYASQEVNATASLIFPQLFFPSPLRFAFNRFNPRTRILAGFNFSNRPEYKRINFKAAMNYTFQKDLKHTFLITPVDLNLIRTPFLAPAFDSTLRAFEEQGSSLRRTFLPSFVSSVSGSYTFNDNLTGKVKEAKYLRVFAEFGGTTLNFIDWLSPNYRVDSAQGVQLFRYFKFNPDFRYYLPAGPKSNWAFRVNLGIASPYGKSVSMPYERYFFAGGSNSIRAWHPRRLGPGADPDALDTTVADGRTIDYGRNYRFEEPGDILLEISAEYRFDIISFLEGALFVDAGNTWMWRSQFNKPEGTFKFNKFYKEIAVGPGFGLRFDFSFLILRFDVGIKAYDPGKPAGEKFMLKNISWQRPFGDKQQTIINIGIGYPF